MKWKKKLVALLPGFLSMGQSDAASALDANIANPFNILDSNVISPLNSETPTYLAGHRSHQSHSSHSSHRSSSGGGYSGGSYNSTPYTAPKPKSEPLSQPASPSYTAPKKSETSKSESDRKMIIMRVQLALKMEGYYDGTIDGVMGPQTRRAVDKYRLDRRLPASVGIDSAMLNALGIATP